MVGSIPDIVSAPVTFGRRQHGYSRSTRDMVTLAIQD